MPLYAPQNITMPVPSGEDLRSRWAEALSNPLITSESYRGKDVRLNPELLSSLLETIGLADPGGALGLANPIGFNIMKHPQWGKAATAAAEGANASLMSKYDTLQRLFANTPLKLREYEALKYLGKNVTAGATDSSVYLPFQYGYDKPLIGWAGKTITTPEEYIKSLLAHESLHLAKNRGGSTIKALEEAISKRPDLATLFSGAESYKSPAKWPEEFMARLGQQVAVPGLPVNLLPHPMDKDLLQSMYSWLTNPNLTVEEMKKISPSLAQAFEITPHWTPPYSGATQLYSDKEIGSLLREEISKTIQKPLKGGVVSSKKGGGLTTPSEIYESGKHGKYARIHLGPEEDILVDMTNMESWPDKVKALFKK